MSEDIDDDDSFRSRQSIEAEFMSLDACTIADDLGLATPGSTARPCPVPVKPGYGQAAFKAGCEDEWIDRMQSRYGGEW